LSVCLDWTEICDGQIDCLDGGFDEEQCWQLEINESEENEYRCKNGQCIPQSFYQDEDGADFSDETSAPLSIKVFCEYNDPSSFACEDILGQNARVINSYVKKRTELLMKIIYSNSPTYENCSVAFKCLFNLTDSNYTSCKELCKHDGRIKTIQNTCPNMLYLPNTPVLFGNIYFAYSRDDLKNLTSLPILPFYIYYDKSNYDDFLINTTMIFFNNMTCIYSEPFFSSWLSSFFFIEVLYMHSINKLYEVLHRYHLIFNYTSEICNQSSMYQCINSSKCISIYRLLDTVDDCPYADDENITLINTPDIIKKLDETHFKCQTSGKYISRSLVKNGRCNCPPFVLFGVKMKIKISYIYTRTSYFNIFAMDLLIYHQY
jgi:hypothetical protein